MKDIKKKKKRGRSHFHTYGGVSLPRGCVLSHFSPTLWDPMDFSPPGSSVHGILQAWILKWVATPSSRGSSLHRDQTDVSYVSCIGRWILYHLGSPQAHPSVVEMDMFVGCWLCAWPLQTFLFWCSQQPCDRVDQVSKLDMFALQNTDPPLPEAQA